MPVSFSSDQQLERAARELAGIPGGVERAAVPALNRASLAARTAGLRRLMATYAAPRSELIKSVTMVRATRGNLVAGFSSKGRRLPLSSFSLRPKGPTTKRQKLRVNVRRDSGSKEIPRAFANVVHGRSQLMVMRRDEGAGRYPIHALTGPATAQMFGESGVREEIEGHALEVLASRFDHEIGRVLNPKGAR
jgi:hypothetical protein